MIPQVKIRYSNVYDNKWRELYNLSKRGKGKEYPLPEEVIKYGNEIIKLWKKDGERILREVSKVAGLKWGEKKITCYIIGKGYSFSDPLTMKMRKDKKLFIDNLTHELIHNIQSQNSDLMRKWWAYNSAQYKSEPKNTRSHIFVHAVHATILLNLFDKKRLNSEIKDVYLDPEYKRSWEIVKKETPKKIIGDFKRVIKS